MKKREKQTKNEECSADIYEAVPVIYDDRDLSCDYDTFDSNGIRKD